MLDQQPQPQAAAEKFRILNLDQAREKKRWGGAKKFAPACVGWK